MQYVKAVVVLGAASWMYMANWGNPAMRAALMSLGVVQAATALPATVKTTLGV